MSTAKLSSLSFQTLSLLLERQRLQNLGKTPPSSSLSTVKKNLGALRQGIVELEKEQLDALSLSSTSPTRVNDLKNALHITEQLRAQWERAKRMLGNDGDDIDDLPPPARPEPEPASLAVSGVPYPNPFESSSSLSPFTPYSDNPPPQPPTPDVNPHEEMQMQREMMDEQDTHLETLTSSIRRQREISENIGAELDVHTGLLEDLESGIDNTALRLGGARRKLDVFAKGARDNCSAVTIGTLIAILLILIVIFKT